MFNSHHVLPRRKEQQHHQTTEDLLIFNKDVAGEKNGKCLVKMFLDIRETFECESAGECTTEVLHLT